MTARGGGAWQEALGACHMAQTRQRGREAFAALGFGFDARGGVGVELRRRLAPGQRLELRQRHPIWRGFGRSGSGGSRRAGDEQVSRTSSVENAPGAEADHEQHPQRKHERARHIPTAAAGRGEWGRRRRGGGGTEEARARERERVGQRVGISLGGRRQFLDLGDQRFEAGFELGAVGRAEIDARGALKRSRRRSARQFDADQLFALQRQGRQHHLPGRGWGGRPDRQHTLGRIDGFGHLCLGGGRRAGLEAERRQRRAKAARGRVLAGRRGDANLRHASPHRR